MVVNYLGRRFLNQAPVKETNSTSKWLEEPDGLGRIVRTTDTLEYLACRKQQPSGLANRNCIQSSP
jgi:hypothetical protein